MKTSNILFALIAIGLCSSALAHSWLACTDYRYEVGTPSQFYYDESKCHAYARNWKSVASDFGVDRGFDYQSNDAKACRDPLNIADSYTSQYPMASYAPGQQVCLAWPSKNHVAATCTNPYIPDTALKVFAVRTGSSDPTQTTFRNNQIVDMGGHVNGVIDFKGFQNCSKFCENMDKSLCTGCFTLPSNMASGTYTFQWYWIFNNGAPPYTTCWEGKVGSGSSTTAPATTGTTTAKATTGTATTGPATTGPATTGPATTGTTTAKATTGTATSTSGSSTSGGGISVKEILIIARSPTTIPQSGSFNVSIAYNAAASRDIVIDLMDKTNNNWYGKGTTTVPAGKGSGVVTVNTQNYPQRSTNYYLHAWSVDAGMANVYGAWNSAYDQHDVDVAVSSALTYAQPC